MDLIDQFSDQVFKENFRINRETFDYLLQLLESDLSSEIPASGRPRISAKHQLSITIWYLATPDCYR